LQPRKARDTTLVHRKYIHKRLPNIEKKRNKNSKRKKLKTGKLLNAACNNWRVKRSDGECGEEHI
jgi:hypothetical protein